MARTVRTPGATEESTEEVQATEATPPADEVVEPELVEQAELSDEPVDQSTLLEILAGQKRIEDKLDSISQKLGVQQGNRAKKRFTFIEGKGHVMVEE